MKEKLFRTGEERRGFAAPGSSRAVLGGRHEPIERLEKLGRSNGPLYVAAAPPARAVDLVMWERSGGNKDMVDKLVEMWNAKYPDRHINLTYIPHAEMVAKLAQAIASGDVPDLMGMDLIYAPQFEKAGQLVDITDQIGACAGTEDRQPRSHDGRDLRQTPLRRAALRRRLRAVLQQRPLREGRPRSRRSRRPASPNSATDADKITALGGDIKGYYLPGSCAGCNIFTVGPLMWASGAKIEAKDAGDEPLVGDGVAKVLQFERDMVEVGQRPRERPRRERRDVPSAIRRPARSA